MNLLKLPQKKSKKLMTLVHLVDNIYRRHEYIKISMRFREIKDNSRRQLNLHNSVGICVWMIRWLSKDDVASPDYVPYRKIDKKV